MVKVTSNVRWMYTAIVVWQTIDAIQCDDDTYKTNQHVTDESKRMQANKRQSYQVQTKHLNMVEETYFGNRHGLNKRCGKGSDGRTKNAHRRKSMCIQ